MNAFDITTAVTLISNAIACNLTIDELSFLSAIFVQIGDTLATISAQRTICENTDTQKE